MATTLDAIINNGKRILYPGILALALNGCNIHIQGTVVGERRYKDRQGFEYWVIAVKDERGFVDIRLPSAHSPMVYYFDSIINVGDTIRIDYNYFFQEYELSSLKKLK